MIPENLLRIVISRMHSEAVWSRGKAAKRANGRECDPTSPFATQWSVDAQLRLCAGLEGRDVRLAVADALEMEIYARMGRSVSLDRWNDNVPSFAEFHSVLDTTLRRLERGEPVARSWESKGRQN